MSAKIIDLAYKVDRSELKKAGKDIDGLTAKSENFLKKASGLRKALVIGGGITAGIGVATAALAGLAKAGEQAINSMDNIGKSAKKLGLTAESLQELRAVAEAGGVSVTNFDMAFQRFSRRIGDAQRGIGPLLKSFNELGIELKNQDGTLKTNRQLFDEFGAAVTKAGDHTIQMSHAMAGFDVAGAQMLEVLKTNRQEQERIIGTMRKYGAIISNEMIAKAEGAATELGMLNKGIEVMNTQTAAAFAPVTLFWAKLKLGIAQASGQLVEFFTAMDHGLTDKQKEYKFKISLEDTTSSAYQLKVLDSQAHQLEFQIKSTKEQMVALNQVIANIEKTNPQAVVGLKNQLSELKTQVDADTESLKGLNEQRKQLGEQVASGPPPSSTEIAVAKKANDALNELQKQARDARIAGLKDETIRKRKELEAQIADNRAALEQQIKDEQYTEEQAAQLRAKFNQIAVQQRANLNADIQAKREEDLTKAEETMTKELAARQKQVTTLQQLADKTGLALVTDERQKIIANAEAEIEAIQKQVDAVKQGTIDRVEAENAAAIAISNIRQKLTNDLAEHDKTAVDRTLEEWSKMAVSMETVGEKAFGTIGSAIDQFVDNGKLSLSDLTRSFFAELLKMELRALASNVFKAIGGSSIGTAIGALFGAANGAAFVGGKVQAYANGGILDKPTLFSHGSGQLGIAGEAGTEAVLPLTRKNGVMGVNASNVGGTKVININTEVTVQGQADGNQIANSTVQAIKGLVIQTIREESQPGGTMNPAFVQ